MTLILNYSLGIDSTTFTAGEIENEACNIIYSRLCFIFFDSYMEAVSGLFTRVFHSF